MNKVSVPNVLRRTWVHFSDELSRFPLPHFTESVFRYFFVRSMLELYPSVRCETEWKKCDLFFFDSMGPSVIEFKFYVHNRHRDFQGKNRYWKGGAGQQNFDEFCGCVRKLVDFDKVSWGKDRGLDVKNRYLILAYANTSEHKEERSYRYWYDRLVLPEGLSRRVKMRRVTRLTDTLCNQTKHKMRCSLFRVQPNKDQ